MIAISLALVVTGCSSAANNEAQGNGDAAEGSPVTIRLMNSLTGSQPEALVFEPLIEKFDQEHEDINVRVETAAGNSIREKLLAEVAANNTPDLFVHWGVRRTENYLKEGKIADLSELIEQDSEVKDLYPEESYNGVVYQGGTYGLPLTNYSYYMMINRELFEQHNVEVPTTYDELVAAIETFKQAGLIPFAANNHSARYMMLTWLAQKTTTEELIQRTTANEPFGDELLQAAEKAVALQKMGAFPEGKETLATAQSLELFNAERSPMFYQLGWTIGSINPDLLDKLEVVPFPLADAEAESTVLSGTGFYIYMSQDAYDDPLRRDAAWKLMKTLAGPEFGKPLQEQGIGITPIPGEYDVSQTSVVFQQVLEQLEQARTIPSMDEQMLSQKVSDEYWTLTDQLSLEAITPQQYVEELNKLIADNPSIQF
ncbi:ABC transporter substrate-binding protein [Paenibacillus sp. S150]|uniref:ABC transporter substrate-binding protein n=1 Tax=Paenibacillus sp. S150 TaxID=2749826 RepID=UPI001C567ACA|nr:extracellular solute-binding protein [Paenibacillus sp. S150]MBW4082225.1 extracellular solute-binding protein [Paenibacillus sp. S150]